MSRRALQGANWGVFLLLCLALFGLINYLSFRHYRRWDLTAGGSFSLSDQTRNALKGLQEPLDVVVFLSPSDELFDRVKGLLTAYQEAGGGRVRLEYLDADRQKERLQTLAKRYRVTQPNCVVFSSGEQSRFVEKDQMVEYDFSAYQMGGPPKVKAFKAEEAFTNALFSVLNPAKPTVYFTTGHGERGGTGAGGAGLLLLRTRLQGEGATLNDFPTLGKGAVPPDASLVVVAGPQYPLSAEEAALLDRYLSGGGHLLLLLDPLFTEGKSPTFAPTGLEILCARWGVALKDDIALDPELGVSQLGAQTFYAAELSSHPATRDLARNQLPIIFALARSLSLVTPQEAEYRSQFLARTSDKAWGETDLASLEKGVRKDDRDSAGPLTLAAAVWSDKTEKTARLVVVGDSDVASDSLAQSAAGNLLFLLNSVHWLLSQENRIAIPPKTAVETHLALTGSQANFLFLTLTFLLPAAVVGLGGWVYVRRRR